MAKANFRYLADKKDPKRRTLFCLDCASGRFAVVHMKMAKQKKSMTAHHMRLVARCIGCGKEKRIGFKG